MLETENSEKIIGAKYLRFVSILRVCSLGKSEKAGEKGGKEIELVILKNVGIFLDGLEREWS